jgi:hypothetical protein
MKTFAARYRDHLGEESTTIVNDGKLLTMELRGVQFQLESTTSNRLTRQILQIWHHFN